MSGVISPYPLGLALQKATPVAGFALQNATPTILSWTAPNDGLLHRVLVFACMDVTVAETGGNVIIGLAMPDGVGGGPALMNGNQGTGFNYGYSSAAFIIKAGSTVTVQQSVALTAGAATLWAEIWGS